MGSRRPGPGRVLRLVGVLAAAAVMLGGPAVALAHGLSPAYQSPLPLAVYVAGAAATVALSFAFVLARDVRAGPPEPGRVAPVPAFVRIGLRAIGLLGWAWIMAQGIAGGSSDAAVAGLFLWIYGWVGIAILSALVFPVWEWLDPFATLHDAGAWVLRRLRVRGWEPSPLPRRARLWPAVAGFAFVVWLELAAIPGNAELTVVLAGYTVLTLALMAQYGRDPWRAHGETFSVWFRTLNRLAAMGVAPAAGPAVRPGRGRRPVVPPAALRVGPPGGSLGAGADRAGRHRDRRDRVRRPVADRHVRGGLRLTRAPGPDGPAVRVPGAHRRGRAVRGSDGQPGGDRGGTAADRRRLPRRPLPDVPADRRPGDRHRRL